MTLSLHQKLIEVRKSVPYLQKDRNSPQLQYSYVSGSQTTGALRGVMDDLGLLLVPEITGYEVREFKTARGGTMFLSLLAMRFTWINAEAPDQRLECLWHAQGTDQLEKGPGKAVTYAEKSFLLKFFQIPTDSEDPDRFAQMVGDQQRPAKDELATEEQRKALVECGRNPLGSDDMKAALREAYRDPELTKGKAGWLIDGARKKLAELEAAAQGEAA